MYKIFIRYNKKGTTEIITYKCLGKDLKLFLQAIQIIFL